MLNSLKFGGQNRWRTVLFCFAISAVLSILQSSNAFTDTFTIDPAHTSVGFEVSHLTISKVQGRFDRFNGTIEYDAASPTKASARGVIKVASINTENSKRDKHLRSADFFDATAFPEIVFATSGIEKSGSQLIATGTLTIRGISKTVRFPVDMRGPVSDPFGPGQRIGLSGELKINRQDFGVRYNKTMEAGGLVVGNEVRIKLEVEAVSKGK